VQRAGTYPDIYLRRLPSIYALQSSDRASCNRDLLDVAAEAWTRLWAARGWSMPSRAGQSRERLRTLIPARFQGSPPIHAVTVQYYYDTAAAPMEWREHMPLKIAQENCQANVPQTLPGKMVVFWVNHTLDAQTRCVFSSDRPGLAEVLRPMSR